MIRGSNPTPSTLCLDLENDEIRPLGFLALLSLISEPEISQNLGLVQMNQHISCHFHCLSLFYEVISHFTNPDSFLSIPSTATLA